MYKLRSYDKFSKYHGLLLQYDNIHDALRHVIDMFGITVGPVGEHLYHISCDKFDMDVTATCEFEAINRALVEYGDFYVVPYEI